MRLTNFPIESLTCYQLAGTEKVRMGKSHDGGYVIVDGLFYDLLISCGIGRDDSFERDFLNRHDALECHAFDGNIKKFPHPDPRVHFSKKNIRTEESDTSTNLHGLIETGENIFLKMDIEHGEFPWIRNLPSEQLMRFKQIVIEIHKPFEKERWECLQKLAETHYLVHLHGNNFGSCALHQFGEIGEIVIGSSKEPSKRIKLGRSYPADTRLVIKRERVEDRFSYRLEGDTLEVRRLDKDAGWKHRHVAIANAQYVPSVFECTYVRKSDAPGTVELSRQPVPSDLDMPNYSKKVDIILSGYPYSI